MTAIEGEVLSVDGRVLLAPGDGQYGIGFDGAYRWSATVWVQVAGRPCPVDAHRPTVADVTGMVMAMDALAGGAAFLGRYPHERDDVELLAGCPREVWDGPYMYRCALGKTECAYHGPFTPARRCTAVAGCPRPEGHGGRCTPRQVTA